MDIKSKLRHIMHFPKVGIDFIDITTVLQDPEYLKLCIDNMQEKLHELGEFDFIAGPESRGFIFGMPLAYTCHKGFIPIRKKGKLPYSTVGVEYESEYGTSILEIHQDALVPNNKVVIVDDLLATGGTTKANIELVNKLGGVVIGILYFIELSHLNGRKILTPYLDDHFIKSVVTF